jgi:hypothetical protein
MSDEQSFGPAALVHEACSAKFSGMTGDDRADERARSNPDLQGLTPEGIGRLLHAYVAHPSKTLRQMRP